MLQRKRAERPQCVLIRTLAMPPVRAGRRWADLHHLAAEVQDILGADGRGPAQLVHAGPDDAARDRQPALDEQAHGQRRRVPAACRQAAEQRALRGCVVQMERLGVKLGREPADDVGIDGQGARAENLAGLHVVEMDVFGHRLPFLWPASLEPVPGQ
jgi:hypothetical protein